MKVNHTSASHLLALLALFTLIYIIYLTGPSVNFSPKHKHRHHHHLKRRTIIIADKPINTNTFNYNGPFDNQLSSSKNLQNISDCQCFRKWMYPPTARNPQRLNSSCSDEGTHYQSLQKVISFSMSLPPDTSITTTTLQSYSKGLLQNLLKMRHLYPGYSIRLYTSPFSKTPPTLHPNSPFCALICQNPDLFWCSIRSTPSHGDLHTLPHQTWRYLPLGDPTVGIFHSRDLSSMISYREAGAVQHWLSEGHNNHKAIMVMRDRKVGHDAPMLGNLWSADNTKLGDKGGAAGALRDQLIWMARKGQDGDKVILEKVIFYPMAKVRDVVAYDSYNCVKWGKWTEVRAFPTQRQDVFKDVVQSEGEWGRKWNRTAGAAVERCPVECRPDYGKDWVYC